MVKIVIYVAQSQSTFTDITEGSFNPMHMLGLLQSNRMRLMLVLSIISMVKGEKTHL